MIEDTTKVKQNKQVNRLKGRIQNSLSGFLRVCLVGLLVIFQFAIIILLPYVLQNFTIYFYMILEVSSLIVILGLLNDNKSPSYKMSWLFICLLLPISGHIMYALWGKTSRKRKMENVIRIKMNYGRHFLKVDKHVIEDFAKHNVNPGRLSKYMGSSGFPLFNNNVITYFSMGEDAFEVIFQELERAQKFILIDFYIVAEGALWDKMHEILLEKIKQGVEVKFLYDDFGATIRTGKNFRKNLEAEGFEVRVFNPIHKYTDKLYMNYRSHQKIIVVDGNIGITGGFNLADEYANLVERFGVWKDTGIRLEGKAVWGLTVVFLQMWCVCSPNEYVNYDRYRPTKKFPHNDLYCHVISDGPYNNPKNPIETIYKQMINYADECLYIMTPYLIIEDYMQEALCEAVKRGVDVRIITPNIPDKKSIKRLTNYNYGKLLDNGVRIFEYSPGFMHAKVIMNEFSAIVGTINMDYRSFYLHYENGVWMSHESAVKQVRKDFKETLAMSTEITYEEWLNRPWTLKLVQQVMSLFSTLF